MGIFRVGAGGGGGGAGGWGGGSPPIGHPQKMYNVKMMLVAARYCNIVVFCNSTGMEECKYHN